MQYRDVLRLLFVAALAVGSTGCYGLLPTQPSHVRQIDRYGRDGVPHTEAWEVTNRAGDKVERYVLPAGGSPVGGGLMTWTPGLEGQSVNVQTPVYYGVNKDQAETDETQNDAIRGLYETQCSLPGVNCPKKANH